MLSGAIYPAIQLVEDFGLKVDWADCFPGVANHYATSLGEIRSFPCNSSTALLCWNRDARAKIGKSQAPATIEEWLADLRKMKQTGVECGFAFDYDTWMPLEQFSAIHNLPIATRDNGYAGLDAEVVFNKTRFADYMKDWKKLLDEGVARIQTTQTGKILLQAFADGTCASVLTSSAVRGPARRGAVDVDRDRLHTDQQFGVPLPQGKAFLRGSALRRPLHRDRVPDRDAAIRPLARHPSR